MFYLKKTLEVAIAHSLDLDYDSPCKYLHGHNFRITVYCRKQSLNSNGMIIDFKEIKKLVHDKLDHKNLNDVFSFNPTAESIAECLCLTVPFCYKVTIQESTNSEVTYEKG